MKGTSTSEGDALLNDKGQSLFYCKGITNSIYFHQAVLQSGE